MCGGEQQGTPVVNASKCECKCKNGFTGPGCTVPVCNCGNNGKCTKMDDGSKVCVCKDGWKGKNCDKPTCPIPKGGKEVCCGNGKPVLAANGECKCKCKTGWKRSDCCKSDCQTKPDADGKKRLCCGTVRPGTPIYVDGKCACKLKTGKIMTGEKICVPEPTPVPTQSPTTYKKWPCPADGLGKECGGKLRGVPVYTNKTKCDKSSGDLMCGPSCECKCLKGIKGNSCELPTCPGGKPDCGGPNRAKKVVFDKGKCSCKCKTGWMEPDCKKPHPKCTDYASTAKNGTLVLCNANGKVTIDKAGNCGCVCKKGYKLPDCKYKECSKDQHGQECGCKERGVPGNRADGSCKCTCRDGWKGVSI